MGNPPAIRARRPSVVPRGAVVGDGGDRSLVIPRSVGQVCLMLWYIDVDVASASLFYMSVGRLVCQ